MCKSYIFNSFKLLMDSSLESIRIRFFWEVESKSDSDPHFFHYIKQWLAHRLRNLGFVCAIYAKNSGFVGSV